MKYHYFDEMSAIAGLALTSGGKMTGRTTLEWDISGNCTDEVTRIQHGRPDDRSRKTFLFTIEYKVRCRKCENCRKARASYWTIRAKSEVQLASRTWFGTLTLRPENHYIILMETIARLKIRCVQFHELDLGQQFIERHNTIGRELTLMLKRIRKNTSKPFRYFIVAEAHKSGLPHYHMLLHEYHDKEIRKREIQREWRHGFSQFKLVDKLDEKAANYVCKYLGKSTVSRVRASVRYGKTL